ncbi:hypothetical protein RF11_07031 [Thelohanellus kitauei]|uniref:Uncharacterized protein n=1 Tax=Thelohanellus kitauei TaxID=669202 RepID=A0A0C2NEP7_THEKT|nr:hypothetical protein RF11_07031 [Thelohanellus kitauei]
MLIFTGCHRDIQNADHCSVCRVELSRPMLHPDVDFTLAASKICLIFIGHDCRGILNLVRCYLEPDMTVILIWVQENTGSMCGPVSHRQLRQKRPAMYRFNAF